MSPNTLRTKEMDALTDPSLHRSSPQALVAETTLLWSEGIYASSADAVHMTNPGLTLPPEKKSIKVLYHDPAWPLVTEKDFLEAARAIHLLPHTSNRHPESRVDVSSKYPSRHDVDVRSIKRRKLNQGATTSTPSVSFSAIKRNSNVEGDMQLVSSSIPNGPRPIEIERKEGGVGGMSNLHNSEHQISQATLEIEKQIKTSRAGSISSRVGLLPVKDLQDSIGKPAGSVDISERLQGTTGDFYIVVKHQGQEAISNVAQRCERIFSLQNDRFVFGESNESSEEESGFSEDRASLDPDVPLESVERDDGDVGADVDRGAHASCYARLSETSAVHTSSADQEARSHTPTSVVPTLPNLNPKLPRRPHSPSPQSVLNLNGTQNQPHRQDQEARASVKVQPLPKDYCLQENVLKSIAIILAPANHRANIFKIFAKFQNSTSLPEVPLLIRDRLDSLLEKYRTDPNFLISTLSYMTQKMGESISNHASFVISLRHLLAEFGGLNTGKALDGNNEEVDTPNDGYCLPNIPQLESMSTTQIRAELARLKKRMLNSESRAQKYKNERDHYQRISQRVVIRRQDGSPTAPPQTSCLGPLTASLTPFSRKQLESVEMPVWICDFKTSNSLECGKLNVRFDTFLSDNDGITVGVENMTCSRCRQPPAHARNTFPADDINASVQQFTVVSTTQISHSDSFGQSSTPDQPRTVVHVPEQNQLRQYYRPTPISTAKESPASHQQDSQTTSKGSSRRSRQPTSRNATRQDKQVTSNSFEGQDHDATNHGFNDQRHSFTSSTFPDASIQTGSSVNVVSPIAMPQSSFQFISSGPEACLMSSSSPVNDEAHFFDSPPRKTSKKQSGTAQKVVARQKSQYLGSSQGDQTPLLQTPQQLLKNKRSHVVLESDDNNLFDNIVVPNGFNTSSDSLVYGTPSKKARTSVNLMVPQEDINQTGGNPSNPLDIDDSSLSLPLAPRKLIRKAAKPNLKRQIENTIRNSAMEAVHSMLDHSLGGPRKSWEKTRGVPLPPAALKPVSALTVDLIQVDNSEEDAEFELDDDPVYMAGSTSSEMRDVAGTSLAGGNTPAGGMYSNDGKFPGGDKNLGGGESFGGGGTVGDFGSQYASQHLVPETFYDPFLAAAATLPCPAPSPEQEQSTTITMNAPVVDDLEEYDDLYAALSAELDALQEEEERGSSFASTVPLGEERGAREESVVSEEE